MASPWDHPLSPAQLTPAYRVQSYTITIPFTGNGDREWIPGDPNRVMIQAWIDGASTFFAYPVVPGVTRRGFLFGNTTAIQFPTFADWGPLVGYPWQVSQSAALTICTVLLSFDPGMLAVNRPFEPPLEELPSVPLAHNGWIARQLQERKRQMRNFTRPQPRG